LSCSWQHVLAAPSGCRPSPFIFTQQQAVNVAIHYNHSHHFFQAAEEDDKLRAMEIARMGETAYMTKVKDTLQTTDAPQW